jgi:hypothetical protein
VAESARPVRAVMTDTRSGCIKNPNEKRYSSLLVSVMLPSSLLPSSVAVIDVATDVRIEGVGVDAGGRATIFSFRATTLFVVVVVVMGMGILGGSTLATMSLRLFLVLRRGTFGVRIPTEMCPSRSARSASRSTMMAGAWILPLGIRMGAGGPLRELADLGGGVLERTR